MKSFTKSWLYNSILLTYIEVWKKKHKKSHVYISLAVNFQIFGDIVFNCDQI